MTKKRVLITGISGFIAGHTAVAFLNAGYEVRGTVRSLDKIDKTKKTLAKHADVLKLEFVEADLWSDDGWDVAVKGCSYVVHMASPFPLNSPKNEDDIIRPAVDGTLRVLKAAIQNGVERFVQTSSTVAVTAGHSQDRVDAFTEDDWTNLEGAGVTAYVKSKTLAEKAARDFISNSNSEMHFSTVNPSLVLGPMLGAEFGASLEIVQMFLSGKYPATPKIMFPVVDVRDVAKMHLLAIETNAQSGGRYLAVSDTISMNDFSKCLKTGLGDKARKAPTREMPNWLFRFISLFDKSAKDIVSELGRIYTVDNSKTRKTLKMKEFISANDAIVAAGKSLVDNNLV